jgi:hypothetical protein
MSTPSQTDSKPDELARPNELARYVPKWARDPANVERRREMRLGEVDGKVPASADGSIRRVEAALNEFKKSLVIDGIEVPPSLIRSLDPVPVPPPRSRPRGPRGSALPRIARLVAVVSVAANVALLMVWQSPAEGWVREKFAGVFGATSTPTPERQAVVAERLAPENVPPRIAEAPSAAPVMALAALEPPAAEPPAAEPAAAEPPAAADQKVSATDAVVSRSAAVKTEAADDSVRRVEPRRLDPEEAQFLFQRGEDFVAAGDFAAARIVFERAADAGHARAAFALAATYDQLVLRRFGIKSLTADLAKARAWYEKAEKLGSADASRRIEMLANLEN